MNNKILIQLFQFLYSAALNLITRGMGNTLQCFYGTGTENNSGRKQNRSATFYQFKQKSFQFICLVVFLSVKMGNDR